MSLMAPPSASKEYPSLLFTPRSGDLTGQPDFRTPRAARSPSSGFGKSGLREGSTPRRRSLSPSGSAQRDAAPPPPPPSESLLDSPASHSLMSWASPAAPGKDRDAAGPSNRATATAAPPTATLQESIAQPPQQPQAQAADEWVTVFGFQPAQLQTVMREFSRCGDIQNFGSFREDHVNWVHVQYANKWQTARALQKNGARLEGGLMIGVRPLDSLDRAAVEAGVDKSGAGGAAALAAWRAPPAQLPSRPYLLTQPAAARASQQAWLPQPSRTAWDKISEIVFGA